MEILNPEIQEHISFYDASIKELKEVHPDLTDERLRDILRDVTFVNTKDIAIKGFLFPFGIMGRHLFFYPILASCVSVAKVGRKTIDFISTALSLITDFLYCMGMFDFIISWFTPGMIKWHELILPLACSFIYYITSRFFNCSHLISEVECYYFERGKEVESNRESKSGTTS
jgi:hypothetical protein